MCEFFSCVSDGQGKVMYFDAAMRKQIIAGESEYHDTDSHTSIAHHHGYKGRDEDKLNKYEYNPLTRKFTVDQINTTDDGKAVERFCRNLDWSTVVPELVIKPIVHPLKDVQAGPVTEHEIELLHQWASVWDSVGASVGASVWASVGASVGASVWDSVWASVKASVWDSVGASVGASVKASVWDSVGASVVTYISSFFDLPEWHDGNPYQSAIDLWESGFVPVLIGDDWALCAGPEAEIVYRESDDGH